MCLLKGIKYILFKYSTSDTHFGSLYINEMNNVKTRFESLFDAKVRDRVKMDGKIGLLRDIILEIKVNKVPLFVGVEQGTRSNSDNVLLLTTLSLQREAQK